jgi:hypothetical protein
MDNARYIPPRRWRDMSPRRWWNSFAVRCLALAIVVAVIALFYCHARN